MTVSGRPWLGIAVALLVLAGLGEAGHGPTLHVSGLSATQFRLGGQGHTVDFEVANDGAQSVSQIVVSFPSGVSEPIAFQSAAADGWTATLSSTPNSAPGNDRAVLTGSLAAGASTPVTLTFASAAGTVDGQVTITVAAGDQVDTFTLSLCTCLLVVSPTSVVVDEAGDPAPVNVRLSSAPTSNVQVSLSTNDQSVARVNAPTGATLPLIFTPQNWATVQTVTIQGQEDSIDGPARSTKIVASVADAQSAEEYDAAPNVEVNVQVTDDDTAGIILAETGDGTVAFEGADTDTFTVKLATQPSANVVLNVAIADAAQAQVDKATLTFTPANWNNAQTVKVTAADDTALEALVTSTQATVSVAPQVGTGGNQADEYDAALTQAITVSVVDNEGVGVSVVHTDGDTTIGEAADQHTDSFTVVLMRQPLHNVVLDVAAQTVSQADLSILPTSLTFTPSNWQIPQSVSVTAVDDTIGEGTEIANVDVSVRTTNSASSAEYSKVPKQTVPVTIRDDDIIGFSVVRTGTFTTTSEAGAASDVTVAVKLNRQPQGPVKIRATSTDTTEIVIQTTQPVLPFTTANWDTAQTITLRGVDDTLRDGHQDVNITFTVEPDSHALWRDLPAQNLTIRNRDNEQTVMIRPAVLSVAEGASGVYEVSLTLAPAANTNVKVRVLPEAGLSANTTLLTFTTLNWNEPQTVRITADDDGERIGDRTLNVTHTATSADAAYMGAPVDSLQVTVVDDERYDLADANQAIQKTVEVERRSGDNIISWDIGVVEGEPLGVQIWRSSSPFAIVASLDNETPEFRDGSYRDRSGGSEAQYIVTVFFGHTAAEGRFAPNTALALVPGYLGMSLEDQERLGIGVSSGEGLSTGALAAIIVLAAVALIVLVVVIVAAGRRRKAPDDEAAFADRPAVEQGSAGWGAWAQPEEGETFHLTCPSCHSDFDAVGTRPLRTRCPHCGVSGMLR